MHVYERRLHRLRELLKEHSRKELAEASGIAASTISRYLSEPESVGHKNISEENARKLESAGHKVEGWLDKPLAPSSGPSVQGVSSAVVEKTATPWPFKRLSFKAWSKFDQLDLAVAEDAYLEKLKDLAAERAAGMPSHASRKQA